MNAVTKAGELKYPLFLSSAALQELNRQLGWLVRIISTFVSIYPLPEFSFIKNLCYYCLLDFWKINPHLLVRVSIYLSTSPLIKTERTYVLETNSSLYQIKIRQTSLLPSIHTNCNKVSNPARIPHPPPPPPLPTSHSHQQPSDPCISHSLP